MLLGLVEHGKGELGILSVYRSFLLTELGTRVSKLIPVHKI